ncbi:MAG TPA: hypothetical protein VK629_15785 [Steroidobacteraceae bacterium]|nr:hypothetical protein [Steroidobacteraceae bacterium]
MSLRDQVDALLPGWESWYPSVFDAAVDLGILRARVCAPGSLLLSRRHASVYNEALQAFREQWSVVESEGQDAESNPRIRTARESNEDPLDIDRPIDNSFDAGPPDLGTTQ